MLTSPENIKSGSKFNNVVSYEAKMQKINHLYTLTPQILNNERQLFLVSLKTNLTTGV